MSSKGTLSREHGVPKGIFGQTLMLWGAVVALTAYRILIASSGTANERESLIALCAAHPGGGYVEGPPGVPLLAALGTMLCGGSTTVLRWYSPAALLILSAGVAWIARRLAPHRPSAALWAVLVLNILPLPNLFSLVMDGAMVTAALCVIALIAAWRAVEARGRGVTASWAIFGAVLGGATLFSYPVAWLLPSALLARFVFHGLHGMPWRGFLSAFGFLLLGWAFPLWWNFRHDWIQWSSVAAGWNAYPCGDFLSFGPWITASLACSALVLLAGLFCLLVKVCRWEPERRLLLLSFPWLAVPAYQFFYRHNGTVSAALILTLSALLIPSAIILGLSGRWSLRVGLLLLLIAGSGSTLILLHPACIPPGLPSPIGVQGTAELLGKILQIRRERPDPQGRESFLIASKPGLAAVLGHDLSVSYPERPGAPPVFAAESPSLNSSFALWPGYADAVAAGVIDPLYTEEKSMSPFLGCNALYITTESGEELPQTITGAFGAVGLLQEMTLWMDGRATSIRIYQCEGYHSLSL